MTDQVLTLLALAYESELFNEVRATGEEQWVDPHDPSDVVDCLDDLALGRWAAEHSVEEWTIPESRSDLLRQCVEQRASAVMRTLVDEVGGLESLFLSLWEQSAEHAQFPLTTVERDRILQRAGRQEQMAYEWLRERHGRG